jgi:putative ABC transport system permease protein
MNLPDWLDRILTEERREALRRGTATLRLDLSLAARSVLRQRRRSLFGLFAVAFGVAALMIAAGFFEFNYDSMREGVIRSRLGHIQAVKRGYLESGASDPFKYIIPETSEDRLLLQSAPYVTVVAPRLSFNGLISKGESTIAFLGEGVDPVPEAKASSFVPIVEGRNLAGPDVSEVILGRGLAENLGAKVGDKVVLLATSARGAVNAVEVTVSGMFISSSKAYDDFALRLPLGTAQALLRTEGVHSWLMVLEHTDRTEYVLKKTEPKIKSSEIDLVPWYEAPMADFYNKTVELFSSQVGILRVLVAIIIVLSISNTLMNNVRERTGEIGTCMALGDTRRTVLRRFIVEGAVVGFFGGIAGIVLGLVLGGVVSYYGIPMPPPPGMTIGYTARIFITPRIVFDAMLLAVVTAFLAGIFPAWKASRMVITDAIRHGR